MVVWIDSDSDRGCGRVTICDAFTSRVITEIGASVFGDGHVVIHNAEGKPVVGMGAGDFRNGSVETRNAEGELLATMGADVLGNGYVEISKGDGFVETYNAKGVWNSP